MTIGTAVRIMLQLDLHILAATMCVDVDLMDLNDQLIVYLVTIQSSSRSGVNSWSWRILPWNQSFADILESQRISRLNSHLV